MDLLFFNGLADDGLDVLRLRPAGVAHVYLVVAAPHTVAFLLDEPVEAPDGGALLAVGAQVHYLGAQALVERF